VWPLLAPVWVVLVSAVAFYGTPRFRAPAEPVVVVLAAIGICWLLGRRRTSLAPTVPAGADRTRNATAPQEVGAAPPAGPAI